jgi:hypothetical protein
MDRAHRTVGDRLDELVAPADHRIDVTRHR